jgi:hypothetical protein
MRTPLAVSLTVVLVSLSAASVRIFGSVLPQRPGLRHQIRQIRGTTRQTNPRRWKLDKWSSTGGAVPDNNQAPSGDRTIYIGLDFFDTWASKHDYGRRCE